MATQNLIDLNTLSPKFKDLYAKAKDFVENDCIPAEKTYELQMGQNENRWKIVPPVIEELKAKAKSLGLWNLFLGRDYPEGAGLTNVEYALIAELTGRSPKIAPEAMNCSAPDTGNMEVFAKYGTPAQKKKWLEPLLQGKIRSAFAMTEPRVASSDATNIETNIRREGNEYVINGLKWWISGAGDPRCAVYLVMGKTDPDNKHKHRQQSLVIVPADTPGITVVRPMKVFGFDDAPEGHCEIVFKDVRVPVENIILGEGRGFEVIQGRLGPGRIHHCMRCIGMAERALDLMLNRVTDTTRRTFGKVLAEHGTIVADIATSRIEIDQARYLVLSAARKIDEAKAKGAMKEIGMAKIVVPTMTLNVLDRAMQAHGAAGISQDTPLAHFYASARTLRYADGPDEVHRAQIGKIELRRAEEVAAKIKVQKEKSDRLASEKAKL
ncbi:acyl-CoA dehydrogenase NM domain-like protein [Rhizopus microsporus var. microsporus]|uniref:Acyl-CoA dehydrogenase NM domain-like protein n=2 Tax=Rhizopus microsporus TaxID=58291 RepID=A0A2G4SUG7_RHIZD|nr:acyl-CoA dehydrogenase NM domain-like protein [Rhizopus microsporus ATCC 52813]ORE04996.1 acyl-CoA dehydrogenase NM domain-like protein [Rhizopus microsporus var. microsporus]PHZ12036.1 acyl-CoA dehydrogenase NM domain-like protein [Rhizopus microsporus ATCC 52813]